MKKISTKNKYLLVIGILLITFIEIGVSYSFYKPRLTKINDTETVIKTNELGLVYTGPNNVSCTNMVPGDKCIKHFTIENTSEVAVTYNIYMEQITNEFNEFLVYTLKDGETTEVEETYLPKTNDEKEYIKMNKTQEPKTTKNYTLTVEYKYSQIADQSKYMGAEFEATGTDYDTRVTQIREAFENQCIEGSTLLCYDDTTICGISSDSTFYCSPRKASFDDTTCSAINSYVSCSAVG